MPAPEQSQALVLALLRQGTSVTFAARGPSMRPTIRDGETVQVHPIQAQDLRPGAILLFQQHGRLSLHRLIRRDGQNWLLAGDASLRGYDRAQSADCIGTAVTLQRHGRPLALNTPATRWAGRLRHALRPLRRLLFGWRHQVHAATPFNNS